MHHVLRLVVVALLAVALFVVLVVVLAWRGQERLVWQPPAAYPRGEVGARRAEYRAEDGQPLFGWLVTRDGAQATTQRVVLAFHGNAEVAAHGLPWALELARRTGWAVFLAEYRGYAGLTGVPTYEGARLDARAAHRWLRDSLRVAPDGIVLFGHSLGSAVAGELAAESPPRALVLQAPFTSARDMARRVGSWPVAAAWPWIGRVRFDTRARVAALDAPVWVVHGARDRTIPTWMGRAVHEAARRRGELLIVPGAGHNDVELVGGAAYWRFLEAALAEGGARAGAPSP